METNRYYMQSSDDRNDDYSFVERGLNWLVEGNTERLVLFLVDIDHIEDSYLSPFIGINYSIEKAKQTRMVRCMGKWISVITEEMMDEINEPVRMLALWADDEILAKLESKYKITNLLVLPWDPYHNINGWKEKFNPKQIFLE